MDLLYCEAIPSAPTAIFFRVVGAALVKLKAPEEVLAVECALFSTVTGKAGGNSAGGTGVAVIYVGLQTWQQSSCFNCSLLVGCTASITWLCHKLGALQQRAELSRTVATGGVQQAREQHVR